MPEEKSGAAWVQSIVDEPLLVSHIHFQSFLDSLYEVSTMVNLGRDLGGDDFWDQKSFMVRHFRPYKVHDGVLRIPVQGALLSKFTYQFDSWVTGYDYIERAFERGMEDPQVKAIVLDVNSPGGQVAGNFELSEKIRSARGEKPLRAYANDLALSGGYAIATAADQIRTSPSASTGSVGVVATHFDVSKMLEKEGVDVSFIFAGKHKVDGNPYQPLSEGAKERIQGGVDKLYEKFVSLVSTNRGLEFEAVQKTEALIFDAEESEEIGFSDGLVDVRTDFSDFSAEVAKQGGMQMSGEGEKVDIETAAPESPTISEKEAGAARDLVRQEERERFSSVCASEEYKGREDLGNEMLKTTDFGSDEIISFLSKAGRVVEKPAVEKPRNHFKEHMDGEKSPEVGVGAEQETDRAEDGRPTASHEILRSYRLAGGVADNGVGAEGK